MNIDDTLKLSLEELGISYSNNQIDTIREFLNIVFNYNKKINLIGTKDKDSIFKRHILDSISILKYKKEFFDSVGEKQKVLDLGTGGGLPGIPLSIFLNESIFYLLDDSLKKISFLNMVVRELNLKNIRIIRGRAEELGGESGYRENFNIVLARAVTKINILNELAIPFCRINGKIIFYKSRKINVEIKKSKESILKLGGKIDNLFEVKVPYMNEYRVFLVISKIKESLEIYPRSFNKIKKNPL